EVYLEHLIQYEIPYEELVKQGLKYVRDRNALYMPLYNPWQFRVGEQLKHLDKDTKPKNLIFKNIDEPLVHFPKTLSLTDYGELVLVEDWISAEKVHEIQPCASLQGTHISPEMISLFKRIGVTKIILMLDGDAKGKAVHMVKQIGPMFEDMRAIYLDHGVDPKDLTYKEIEDKLNEA